MYNLCIFLHSIFDKSEILTAGNVSQNRCGIFTCHTEVSELGVPPTHPKFHHFSIKTYGFFGIPPHTLLCDTSTAAKLDEAQNRMIWECSGQVRLLLCGTSNDKPF